MSIQDPIANMLTSIRNGQLANKKKIEIFSSKFKILIIKLLKKEGFIENYEIKNNMKPILVILLKYYLGKPVIENIKRISRPGLRVYKRKNELPKIISGIGILVISTSQGVMSDYQAKKNNLGGEIICQIS